VVVVGSGATAMTLVPALAPDAAHVVMLQRSPTYVAALPSRDRLAGGVRRVLPEEAAYRVNRSVSIARSGLSYRLSKRYPDRMRSFLLRAVRAQLPDGYDVERDFGPSYGPWDQRLCVVPDGDLFAAMRSGKASVVTDRIAHYTRDGFALVSGREVRADIVVTATGLELLLVGGMTLTVDDVPVDPPETVAYKGMMLSGVPNFAFAIGYTNASWTLKCDLVSRYVCRLLDHLETFDYDAVLPVAPPEPDRLPLLDLSSGYVRRAITDLPKQGVRAPWFLLQNYRKDVRMLLRAPVTDEGVSFSRASERILAR
jgi:cation diffusion facilitator CzcD-associated flavoprotein CzcO